MAASVRGERPSVLVTGAATGIGLAIARRLAAHDWHVVGTAMPDQDPAALSDAGATVAEVELTVPSSLTDLTRSVCAMARLDALVSNAGIAVPGPLEGLSADDLRLQFELNAVAPMALVQGVLPQLRATRGRMVFVGAGQGRAALPFGGPYGASKAALAALTDALSAEIADSGVSVSLIEPGAVRTEILTTSRERGLALLDRLPQHIAERYRDPMIATFARSEKAFQRALSPDKLSHLVLHILTTPKPKPRYLIGREATTLALLAVLPAAWRAKLIARVIHAGHSRTNDTAH